MKLDFDHENTYVKKLCYIENSPLSSIRREAIKAGIPIVGDEMLRYLIFMIKAIRPQRILELGTALGYSGSAMLMSAALASRRDFVPTLYTIEKNQHLQECAIQNFKRLSLADSVKSYLGDASEVLKIIAAENLRFDFVFVDAAKAQYAEYFKALEPLLASGAIVIFDNVLYLGLVSGRRSIRRNNTIRERMGKLIEQLMNNPLYDSSLVQIEGGVLLLKKRA